MAESQVPFEYQDSSEIRSSLSEDRFAPYLKSAGYSETYAFNLYLYNARLSKSFLYPLHVLEVSLRNHISAIFCTEYGDDWPHNEGFRNNLTEESCAALDKGIVRAKSRKTNDIVATLTFDFWSNLFRAEYDRAFWQTHMSVLLPNAKSSTRKDFQKTVRDLNTFRNRIAHHEPIHKVDISTLHAQIIETISWICFETSQWVKHYSTVNQVMRTKPSKDGELAPFFKDFCDKSFETVLLSNNLSTLPSSRFLLCENELGELASVIEVQHVALYLLNLKEGSDLIVDLCVHTIEDVVSYHKLQSNYSICGGHESYSKAKDILRKGISYIVVGEKPVLGLIAKAHRAY